MIGCFGRLESFFNKFLDDAAQISQERSSSTRRMWSAAYMSAGLKPVIILCGCSVPSERRKRALRGKTFNHNPEYQPESNPGSATLINTQNSKLLRDSLGKTLSGIRSV